MFDTGGSIFTPGQRSSGMPSTANKKPMQRARPGQGPINRVNPGIPQARMPMGQQTNTGQLPGGMPNNSPPILNTGPSKPMGPPMMPPPPMPPQNGGGFINPPTGDPMGPMGGGGMMGLPPPDMGRGLMAGGPQGMQGPMMDTGGMAQLMQKLGGMNTGVMGPQAQQGGLWQAYNQMAPDSGMPQRRGLTY